MSYPFFRQLESRDCGPACLRMICKYYSKDFSQKFLQKKCFSKRTGTSLLSISDAAEELGIKTKGVRISFGQLQHYANFPCIIQWNKLHFVVCYEIKKNKVVVGDPASGILEYDTPAFLNCWYSHKNSDDEDVGVALLMEPQDSFFEQENQIEKNLRLKDLTRFLSPHKKFLFQLCIAFLLGSLISLIFPFLTQSIVDIGIANKDINFVVIVLLAQLFLVIGLAANNFISSWLMLHMSTRISISMIDSFLGKLMRLPISFFDKRMLGDLLQRIGDFSRIEQFLTTSVISIFMALAGFLVYSFVLLSYGKILLLIFLIGAILYISWILLFLKKRRKLDYMRFQESASSQSNIIHLINGMQEIKLNNCEKIKRREWQKIQLKLYDISIRGLTLAQTQQIGGAFIDQSKNVLISFFAAQQVIQGNMTLGMMMAVQYIVGQMNGPITQVVGFIKAFQDTKISMERVNEINLKEDEDEVNENKINRIPLHNDICISNLSFHYNGPRSPRVLCEINFTIKADKVTAIVGVSGSGKTTLIRLLLNFYEASKGQISIGGNNIEDYNVREWRKHCGAVMQEGFIFSDTIAKNISLMDEEPDMGKVIEAAKMSCAHEFITSLPLGYNTIIGSDGTTISTGQKQRLLIARAIYKNPPYIFLDEATNSLDANNETIIMKNLKSFYKGKTVVVVAHRLSTVKDADNIIVLDSGRIVEEGNHQYLVKQKGYYYQLVRNQLELGNN